MKLRFNILVEQYIWLYDPHVIVQVDRRLFEPWPLVLVLRALYDSAPPYIISD